NALFRNDLNAELGLFTEIACALSLANAEIGQAGTWADYDNDGDLDLYVSNVGGNALYRNDGDDTFVDVAADAGVNLLSSGWGDVNGDGFLDLYLANGADRQYQPDVLAAGSASGIFADSTSSGGLPAAASYHLSAAFADIDTNGTPDLYVTDGYGYGNQLYQNVAEDSL
ncbi:MAG: VCBS repeat-containing protein, partial [Lentisphaeria bacterium]|nr:VCBS repeat-containing protein [Lentisphaeria bacterium]